MRRLLRERILRLAHRDDLSKASEEFLQVVLADLGHDGGPGGNEQSQRLVRVAPRIFIGENHRSPVDDVVALEELVDIAGRHDDVSEALGVGGSPEDRNVRVDNLPESREVLLQLLCGRLRRQTADLDLLHLRASDVESWFGWRWLRRRRLALRLLFLPFGFLFHLEGEVLSAAAVDRQTVNRVNILERLLHAFKVLKVDESPSRELFSAFLVAHNSDDLAVLGEVLDEFLVGRVLDDAGDHQRLCRPSVVLVVAADVHVNGAAMKIETREKKYFQIF